jgi:RNA-directed DNA polymerase
MIPKRDGGQRALGIPTVSDRIAQTVVAMVLEPILEPHFHPDSYGYRPGKSAIQALGVARQRCWRYDWVLDLDIKGFFDNIDHALLLRALRKHTACPWVLLYVTRWLQAPVQGQDGTLIQRGQGVPQGGCISPILANLFLHYAFDAWMQREHPSIPFERYADDIIAHCQSEAQARWLQARIATRLAQCHLELHPTKTHIVYCKDADRRGSFPQERFDFLGYTFRPRRSKNRRGKYFINFTPAVSARATKAMRQTIRSWRLHLRSDKTLDDLARMFNPILRGWVQYYGQFYKSALYPTFLVLDRILVKWAMRKYKKLKGHQRRATHWLGRIARRQPRLFVHWHMGVRPAAGR